MDIIDKIFSQLKKEQTPWELRDKVFHIMEKQHKPKPFNFRILVPALAVLALVVGGIYYQYFRIADFAAAFELKAENSDIAGITPNSVFILKSSVGLSTYQISKAVKFEPEVGFDVNDLGNNQYRITPKDSLNENQVYKISIAEGVADRGYSWAYQVKAPFTVIGTIPGNKTSGAPANTGIEINFNREQFVDPQNHFEISPKVEGKFEQHGSILIFVPRNPLQEGKIYTVVIKAGLKIKDSDDTLAEDYTFQFEIQGVYGGYSYLGINQQFEHYLSGIAPTVQAYSSATTDLEATVYQFKSADDFLSNYVNSRDWSLGWASFYSSKIKPKVDASMQKVAEFTPEFRNENYQRHFDLPATLPDGYYLLHLRLKNGEHEALQWFEVSPMAHYNAVSYDKTILWLYDFKSNQPIQDAKVSLAGGATLSQTDKEGLAQFTTPSELKSDNKGKFNPFRAYYEDYYSKPALFKVEAAGKNPYFVRVFDQTFYYFGTNRLPAGNQYWQALTLDRPVYRPTDKISFFGVAHLRDNSGHAFDKVQIGINHYEYGPFTGSNNQRLLAATTVDVTKQGTYQGELNFSGLAPGFYDLFAKIDDQVVSQASVRIMDFSKPAYALELKPLKEYAFYGDTVEFAVKAKFFDGSPVSNLDVSFSGYGPDQNINDKLRLNGSGEGTIRIKLSANARDDQYWPAYLSVSVSPTQPEEGSIRTSASLPVYRSSVVLESKTQKVKDNNYKFIAKASELDPGRTRNYYYQTPADSGKVIVNQVVYAEIHKITYSKTQTGEYYDYINKVFYPTYRYDSSDKIQETISGQTNALGEWSFEKSFPKDEAVYYVKFYTFDKQGRKAIDYPLYANFFFSQYYDQGSFELLINGKKDFGLTAKIGEKLELTMSLGSDFKSKNNKTLFYQFQRSIGQATVVDGRSFTDEFRQEDRPSISYKAVVLGSNGFYETYQHEVKFDTEDAKLKIQIDPEKQKYRPGDEVKAKIKVTDNNGNPISGPLNVSVADEALFHVLDYDYNLSMLDQLYMPVTVQPMINYSRFAFKEEGGGGGGGGGDSGAVRSKFSDNLLYTTVTTDQSGLAEISFKLPDNLTAWRITAQAFEPVAIKAGTNATSVNASLPLFVDATLNEAYLVDDQPNIRIRIFGTEFDQSKPTTVSVTSQTLNLTYVEKLTADSVYVPFPKLSAGTHKIVFSVKQGDKTDAVERTIRVVDSNFETPQTKTYYLKESLTDIEGSDKQTTKLLFIDRGRGKFLSELANLSYSNGSRLDQVLAKYFAQNILAQEFGLGTKPDDPNLSLYMSQDYQTGTGLRLLPYSDADLSASALAAALIPEKMPKNSLITYFNSSLFDKKADVHRTVKALFGLSQLDQPVLSKLNAINQDPNLTLEDKVFIALSFASSGDRETARKIYEEKIKPEMEFTSSQAWVDSQKDETMRIKLTGLTGVLLSKIGFNEEADKVWEYLSVNYPQKDTVNFEKTLMVKYGLQNGLPKEAKFAYQIGDEKGQVDLHEHYYGYGMEVTKDDLAKIRFNDIKGDIQVVSLFSKPDKPDSKSNPAVSIIRKYLVNGKSTTKFNVGDKVEVNLTVRVSKDRNISYYVREYLPSGLKASTTAWGLEQAYYYYDSCAGFSYPDSIYQNQVTFTLYSGNYSKCGSSEVVIRYYARVVNAGAFKADSASVAPVDDLSNMSTSGYQTIEIRP